MAIATSTLLNVVLRPPTGVRQLTLTGGVQIDTPVGVTAVVARQTATQGDGLPFGSGAGMWNAASNINGNGNATTNTTGITDHSSTTTRATTGVVKFGTTAFNVVSGNAAANEGPSQVINGGIAATQYSISAWAWLISGAATVRAALSDTVAGKQGGTAVVLTATPQKITVTATTGALALNIASYIETTVQQAGTWRIGGWQSEVGPIATPYIQTDGGDAPRAAGNITMVADGLLTATQGGVITSWTQTWGDALRGIAVQAPFNYAFDANNRICSFPQNAIYRTLRGTAAGSQINDTAITWAAGNYIGISQWDALQVYSSLNGSALTATAGTPRIPTIPLGSLISLGWDYIATGRQMQGQNHYQLLYKGALTAIDVATINAWGVTTPTRNQIAMLSPGSQPTCLVSYDTPIPTATLMPGYFS